MGGGARVNGGPATPEVGAARASTPGSGLGGPGPGQGVPALLFPGALRGAVEGPAPVPQPGPLRPLAIDMLAATSEGVGGAGGALGQGGVLDKAQLKMALLTLISEDDAFVDRIHAVYLAQVKKGGGGRAAPV
jgi:hypothetical protein